MLARDAREARDRVAIVERDDEEVRAVGARGVQQVEARGVAVEHAEAELARLLDVVRVVVEHRGLDSRSRSAGAPPPGRRGRGRRRSPVGCGVVGARAPRAARAKRGAMTRSCSTSRNGVSSIESATASVTPAPCVGVDRAVGRGEAEQHEGELAALREQQDEERPLGCAAKPARRAMSHSTAPLSEKQAQRSGRPRSSGRASSTEKSTLMPTEMKNRPSSRPLNGSIAASISWRYSDSASSTPARNAPSAIDMPARSKASAMPSTSSSANAVKISRSRVRAMWRNTGRARKRPPARACRRSAASASAAFCQRQRRAARRVPSSGSTREHRDHREVLEQQDPRRCPGRPGVRARRARPAARARARWRRATAPCRRRARRASRSRAPGRRERCRDRAQHLRRRRPKQLRPHAPQALRLELQADHEQQEHHAELGEGADLVPVLDQPEAPRADGDARQQVARHRAKAQAVRDHDRQNRGREIQAGHEKKVIAVLHERSIFVAKG